MMIDGYKRLPISWFFIAAALALVWVPCVQGNSPDLEGKPAPEFSLLDLSGAAVSLKDFRGQLVILDFWATWCVPCRKSLPELAALEKKYRDQGLIVLGLAVDDPDSFDNQYIKDFLKKYQVEYRILRADQDVMDRYLGKDDPNVPLLFIVDDKGQILEKHEGYTPGWLEPKLQKYLEQVRPPR